METFGDLSDHDKAAFVYLNGDFVTSIDYYNMKLNLFTVGTEFVEIRYDAFTGEPQSIDILDEESLAIYLKRIDLSDLGVAD